MTTNEPKQGLNIRPAAAADADTVANIYNHYIKYTLVTFEEEEVSAAEITVYLDREQTSRGTGSQLYSEMFPLLESAGVHVVIAGISLPNAASVALHEKFGLRKVAHFNEVGFKLNQWIDVGYWQRIL